MFTAAISTLALALAIGPPLQAGFQLVINEAQAVTIAQAAPVTGPVRADTDTEVTGGVISETKARSETVAEPVTVEATPQDSASRPATEAPAASPEPVELQPQSGEVPQAEWTAILSQASAALSAAKTAKGKFVQTNADGSIATGTFALNRPGRMRFDYDDPTPVLIVSDGTTVAMEDSELETVDRVPIGSTPLGLILATDLNVDQDVDVLSVLRNADRYGIRVEDARGELEGTLTMVFDRSTFDLLGWLATDGNFQTTVVDLTDVETNVRVDPRLFRLDEEEDEEDER